MLAMVVNDDTGYLTPHGECASIASKLAPTDLRKTQINRPAVDGPTTKDPR
jgi:hypothetical protein